MNWYFWLFWLVYELGLLGACVFISIQFHSPWWMLLALLLSNSLKIGGNDD